MWTAWKTARTQLRALHNVHKLPCSIFIHRGFWASFGARCVRPSGGEFVLALNTFGRRWPIECNCGQMVRSLEERSMGLHFVRGFASQEVAERGGEEVRERDSDEAFSDDDLGEETLEIHMQKTKGSLSSDEGSLSGGEGHQTRLEAVEGCSSKSSTGDEDQPEEDGESGVFEETEVFGETMRDPLDIAAEEVVGSINHRVSGVPPLWTMVLKASRKDKKSLCLSETIEKWIEEGNTVSRNVILYILTALRRNRLYGAALQVSDWAMEKKPFELNDLDYSFRVEIVSRVRGIKQAEEYFAKIPEEFQTQLAYCNLLRVYANCLIESKAENLVEKVEKLGIGVTTSMYNQLLLLYRRKGKTKKIVAVVRKMDEAHVQPDCFTYNILLFLKLKKGDITAMDVIAKKMEDDEVKPDSNTFGILAKGYLAAGLTEKAEVAMAQVESGDFSKNRMDYRVLLQLNSQMGKADELERIWGKLLSSASTVLLDDYLHMIEALGKVGKVERAESIFKEMCKSKGKGIGQQTRQHNALLSAYADQGMVVRAEEFLKQMEQEAVTPNFMTYDHLMKMYVGLGLQPKVTEIMEKIRNSMRSNTRSSVKMRPRYVTIQSAIDIFSKNGDVANAERAFKDLKMAGYFPNNSLYCSLLDAYDKAGTAPYGFIDRMVADGAFPNEHVKTVVNKLHGT